MAIYRKKIALLGNLNNNNFSMMRYLRDLGYDAYLLTYQEDGKGSNSHFIPENDTWRINYWKDYIVSTKLNNGGFKSFQHIFYRNYVKSVLNDYDVFLGNGFAPFYAILAKKRLDIFMPYMIGIEFLNLVEVSSLRQLITNWIYRYLQAYGLNNYTNYIATYDYSEENRKNLKFIKTPLLNLPLPMLYLETNVNLVEEISHSLEEYIFEMKSCDLVVFSHVAHIWKDIPENFTDVKRNDLLIQGFAKYKLESKSKCWKSKLFLLEYGSDVLHSKKLIQTLGLDKDVFWIPLMSRKEIMVLLDYVSLGCSELGGLMWGGCGWEFMAKGVPFLHNLHNVNHAFGKAQTPEYINVKTVDDIANQLLAYEGDPGKFKAKGISLQKWFIKNNGIGLVKKYLPYINTE